MGIGSKLKKDDCKGLFTSTILNCKYENKKHKETMYLLHSTSDVTLVIVSLQIPTYLYIHILLCI